jgi:hypothetical protein
VPDVPFPSPPWQLAASAWMSSFRVTRSGRADRPGGWYAVAFVDYTAGGVLAYHELLVARLVRTVPPQVRISDIWVDSLPSLAGGRSLWGIPKDLAVLPLAEEAVGATDRARFGSVVDEHEVASGTFTTLRPAGPRLPFSLTTSQVREDASIALARCRGSARITPCRGVWRFAADGPLGFLHGRRPVVSLRAVDVRLSFG